MPSRRPAASWCITGVLALTLAEPAAAWAQYGLVTLPIDDPAYVQLAALEHAGCAAARIAVDRPYQVRLVRAALVAARAEPTCAGSIFDALARRFALQAADTTQGVRVGAAAQLRSTALHNGEFTPLWENVRPTSDGTPAEVGVVHGRLTYGNSDRVAVVIDGYGESDARNDPTVAARSLRHSSGVLDVAEGYATARAGAFTFTLGRGPEAWLGEGSDSPVLAANGPPYTRVAVAFNTAHFEGRALFGSLDDVVLDSAHDRITSTIGPQRFYRYIAGHTLTWRPSRAIEVTAGETVVIPRGSGTVDFYYLDPFVPYIITAHDTGRTGEGNAHDNLTAFAAIRARAGRVTASAQLLIDDIQVDASRRTNTPDQLGYDLVLASPLPIALPATVQVEYQRIDTYTYMRGFFDEVYQYYNVPLGSELGPDADYGKVSGEIFPIGWMRLAADVGMWRRGLQRIDERPGQEAVGNPSTQFPSQTISQPVQVATLAHASIQLLTAVLPVTGAIVLARIRNADNQPVGAINYARAQLYVTYAFRYP